MSNLPNLFRAFSSGTIGGIANVAAIAILGVTGIIALMGINAPDPEMPDFLYKQMVWGGLWGLLLVTPVLKDSWWQRGLLLGVLATGAALFYFAPQGPAGMMALNLGNLTPVLFLAVNWVYGLAAAWVYQRTS